jgi:hypothetical protein
VPEPRLVTVYIENYATNIWACTAHEAARQACAFFLDPFWKGPKPRAGMVLLISPMGGKRIWVRVKEEWLKG